MKIKLKRVHEEAIIPSRATAGSAAVDLHAVCAHEGIRLEPGQIALIPTGIAIELPDENYVALVFARSGLGVKHGISMVNGVSVIDSDYRGEVHAGLINLSDKPYTIQNGERIAQLAVMPVIPFEVEECDILSDTERANGGFGSTGK